MTSSSPIQAGRKSAARGTDPTMTPSVKSISARPTLHLHASARDVPRSVSARTPRARPATRISFKLAAGEPTAAPAAAPAQRLAVA
jgi:hypothetical protein